MPTAMMPPEEPKQIKNPLIQQRWVVIDVETTGLDPQQHEILEIGAVREDGEHWEQMVQIRHPERLQPDAEAINCAPAWHPDFQESSTKVLPYADKAIKMLIDWLEEYDDLSRWTVIGRNPKFDISFLRAHAGEWLPNVDRRLFKYGLDLHNLVDWALLLMGDNPLKMTKDDKYRQFGFEPERIPHRALQGAVMEDEQRNAIKQQLVQDLVAPI